ncbi:MAG TPA: hypothetical protein VHC69_07175 [Polyangiaceae bacterium]|nr:hypothetical protein [Polyangiaceae bacterium]
MISNFESQIRSARRGRFRRALAGAAAGAACVVLPASRATAEPERSPSHAVAEADRAAVDAQCPWGRLADGHGRFVRCLSAEDAARLREPAAAPSPPAPPEQKVPAAAAVAPAEPIGKAADSGVIWPLPAPKPPATEPAAPPSPPVDEFVAELAPIVADSGTLSDAQKQLRKMRDKLAECASKNGGLTAERGEVELRFLVQERGRAEGVSIKKKRGLGDAAAKCVADVVDRRFVGFPDEPAVGATLVVTITKKKK